MNAKAAGLLEELAGFLDELPALRFNYKHWVGEDWEGDRGLSCGTTACALGWATTLPSWQEQTGLFLEKKFTYSIPMPAVEIDGQRYTELDAVSKALGIPEHEARFLFIPYAWYTGGQPYYNEDGDDNVGSGWRSPGDTASAAEVAQHIRNFLEFTRTGVVPTPA